jgi:hypothetical protein
MELNGIDMFYILWAMTSFWIGQLEINKQKYKYIRVLWKRAICELQIITGISKNLAVSTFKVLEACKYEGNSISKLQIQAATYVF